MTRNAMWTMQEYFNGKGIAISDETLALLREHLEGLVQSLGGDIGSPRDENIEALSETLESSESALEDIKLMTYEYDFTEGSFDSKEAERITKRIIDEIDNAVTNARYTLNRHGV